MFGSGHNAGNPQHLTLKTKGLTPRQAAFVREYIVDLNAHKALSRVVPGHRGASVQASKYLSMPGVREAIAEEQKAIAKRNEITVDRIMAELAKIGFANMQDYYSVGPDGDPHLDFTSLTRDQAAAIVEITVEDFKDGRGDDARDVRRIKFKLADKRAALVDMGKHIGMFQDRHIHTGPDGGPIQHEEVKAARAIIEGAFNRIASRSGAAGIAGPAEPEPVARSEVRLGELGEGRTDNAAG